MLTDRASSRVPFDTTVSIPCSICTTVLKGGEWYTFGTARTFTLHSGTILYLCADCYNVAANRFNSTEGVNYAEQRS